MRVHSVYCAEFSGGASVDSGGFGAADFLDVVHDGQVPSHILVLLYNVITLSLCVMSRYDTRHPVPGTRRMRTIRARSVRREGVGRCAGTVIGRWRTVIIIE